MLASNTFLNADLLNDTAIELGISPAFVEKDWYAVQLISCISDFPYMGFKPIFAGGTSLSKGFGLIKRFSEDLDFMVSYEGVFQRTLFRKYREAIYDRINTYNFFHVKRETHCSFNEGRKFSIDIQYNRLTPMSEVLRPHLKLEISAHEKEFEQSSRDICSFVNELTQNNAETQCRLPLINSVLLSGELMQKTEKNHVGLRRMILLL